MIDEMQCYHPSTFTVRSPFPPVVSRVAPNGRLPDSVEEDGLFALDVHTIRKFWPHFCPFALRMYTKRTKRSSAATGGQPILKEFHCCGTATLCCQLFRGDLVFYMTGQHAACYTEPPPTPFSLTLRSAAPSTSATSRRPPRRRGPPSRNNLPACENPTIQEEAHEGPQALLDDQDVGEGTTTASTTATPLAIDGSIPAMDGSVTDVSIVEGRVALEAEGEEEEGEASENSHSTMEPAAVPAASNVDWGAGLEAEGEEEEDASDDSHPAMDGSEPSSLIAEERAMQEDDPSGSNGKIGIAVPLFLQILDGEEEDEEDNTTGDNCGSSGRGAASTGAALGILDKSFTDNVIQVRGTAAAAVAITTPPLGHDDDKNDSAQDLTGALEAAAMHHTRDLGHVLGVAISDKAPLSVIRAIVEADSLSLLCRRGPNGRGCNPLHRAFGEKEPLLHVLNFLVEEGKAERVPLHLAAGDAPLEVVQLLVNKCPQALMMKDEDNRLPLHVAVAAGSWTCHDKPWKVKPDKTRSLMTSFRSAEVIKCLIEACPGALLVKDDEGNTPLHLAVLFASAEVVRMLVIKCPEALLEKDASGGLPLHVAVSDEATPLGIVRCLVDACPDALHVEKDDENLPLHVAAEHASLDVIRLLVERRPESLLAKNKNGERPVALARYGADGAKELFAQWDADAAAAPAQSQLLQHDPTSEVQQQHEQMDQDAVRPHEEAKNKEEEEENVEEQGQTIPVSSSTLDIQGGGDEEGESERPSSRARVGAAPKIDCGPVPATARTTGSKLKADIANLPFLSQRDKADDDAEVGSGSAVTTHPLGRHDDEALGNHDNDEEASCSTQDSNEEAEECRAAPALDEEDVAHPDAAPSSRGSVIPCPAPSSQGSVFPDLAPSSQGSVIPDPAPSSQGSVLPDPAPSSLGSVVPDPAPSSQGSFFPDPAPSSSLALGEAAAAAVARPLRRRDDDERAIPGTSLSGGVEDLVQPAREGLPPPTSVDSNKKPRIC